MMLMPNQATRRPPLDRRNLPAAHLIPAPIGARRLAKLLGLMLLSALVVSILSPWQQNVSGSGRVIAFAPADRQQSIQSPVKGRVAKWFVVEGERVKEGQILVELQDNDPDYFRRLEQKRETTQVQSNVIQGQVEQLAEYVRSFEEARDRAVEVAAAEVKQAEQKVRAMVQKVEAAQLADETARINQDRTDELFRQGLVSKRKLELTTLKATKARTDFEASEADLAGSKDALRAKQAGLRNKRAEAEAKVRNARSSQAKAQSELQKVAAKLLEIDVDLARQSTRRLRAPIDSYVLRIDKAPSSEQIKAGTTLGVLVPLVNDRVAEVMVDGNDAAIISKGRKVRLQFEGWPAVQFAGWPSVAVGTFGGVVLFVDSASDGKGDFRVLVGPDPDEPEWPDPTYLRQGTRAKAWVLLDKVRLGYELWRRFNGFPPTVKVTEKSKSKAPGESSGKGHSK